jgi:hypothetical protein
MERRMDLETEIAMEEVWGLPLRYIQVRVRLNSPSKITWSS